MLKIIKLLICLLLLFKIKAQTHQQVQIQVKYPFQRNLFVYWHQKITTAPLITRLCYQKLSFICKQSNFTLILLHPQNLPNYISQYEKNFQQIIKKSKQTEIANIADLVRLLVLDQHGGVYVDLSSIFFEGLDWLINIMHPKYQYLITNRFVQEPDVLLFYYGNFQNRLQDRVEIFDQQASKYRTILYNELPGYEVWFWACKRSSALITQIKQTYINFTQLTFAQLQQLFIQQDIYIQNQDVSGNYLAFNMAITYVLQKKQKQLDRSYGVFENRKMVFQEFKLWGIHAEFGPLAFSRKNKVTQLDCFDKTIEEIHQNGVRLMFFIKIVHYVREMFQQKIQLLQKYFKNGALSFSQFMLTQPSLQACKKLKLIVKGSIIQKLLSSNPLQAQLSLPIFTPSQHKSFTSYCTLLNDNIPITPQLSIKQFFESKLSSRGQRAKIQEVQRIYKQDMSFSEWVQYQLAINKFLFTVWISENFIIIMVVAMILVFYNIARKIFICLLTNNTLKKSNTISNTNLQSHKSKSTLQSFIIILCFSLSIMQYTYVDIFGGKDQPMQILIIIVVIFFLQKYERSLKEVKQSDYKPTKLSQSDVRYQDDIQQDHSTSKQYDQANDYEQRVSTSKLLYDFTILFTNFFITYTSLSQVLNHRFYLSFISVLISLYGCCLLKIVQYLQNCQPHRQSQNYILHLLNKISNDSFHSHILIGYLCLINVYPNLKYLVFMDEYLLAQIVLVLPSIYLVLVTLIVTYQCISKSKKHQLAILILMIITIYQLYQLRYKYIYITSDFRCIWVLLIVEVFIVFYLQIDNHKTNNYIHKRQSLVKNILNIIIRFTGIIYILLFGTFYSTISINFIPNSLIQFSLMCLYLIFLYAYINFQYSILTNDINTSNI